MNTTENIAYSAPRAGNATSYSAPAKTKSATPKKRRMSVEEYFGKVLKKLDEHYAKLHV